MEDCELCGRQTKNVYVLDVENVELRTCASCAKGKKVIRTELESVKQKPSARSQAARPMKEEDKPLVDDYAKVIHNARVQMKLPIKVLAEMINEKEHLILRVEEEKTMPSIELTKKLEKLLKIKLTYEPVQETNKFSVKKSGGVTIGDFVEGE
ncbi:MAG: multiprotein bridging factor aMBF1 [Candidatus Micrarchaeales archaeon]